MRDAMEVLLYRLLGTMTNIQSQIRSMQTYAGLWPAIDRSFTSNFVLADKPPQISTSSLPALINEK